MTKQNLFIRLFVIAMLAVPLGALAAPAPELGWINALAPGRDGALVASDRGLFVANPDGRVLLRAQRDGGFIALAADRSKAGVLYASGRSGGLLRSNDGGWHWQHPAAGGPDSFEILATGPSVLYGVADALYQSFDGGSHWRRSGVVPDKLISLAVAAKNAKLLYAGTEAGLMESRDSGAHWQAAVAGPVRQVPATLIRVGDDGSLTRFDWGRGLLIERRANAPWVPINNGFGGQAVLQLVREGRVLVAATNAAKLFVSRDGGSHWLPLGGYPRPVSAAARRGEKLFVADCQVCHGDHGIGEAPRADSPQQSLAPALDETAHAWHHPDQQLEGFILNGLPAPSRMVGWSGRLNAHDAQDLVAYIKSLWTPRALRCQGPRHMDPDCRL